eukprot:758066-Hanusia_phi.AAC.2
MSDSAQQVPGSLRRSPVPEAARRRRLPVLPYGHSPGPDPTVPVRARPGHHPSLAACRAVRRTAGLSGDEVL